jgi:hypothetical protein
VVECRDGCWRRQTSELSKRHSVPARPRPTGSLFVPLVSVLNFFHRPAALPLLSAEGLQKLEEMVRNPPEPDLAFASTAVADIPSFCGYVEEHLALREKPPQDFDTHWLTQDGLSKSKGPFEDFYDRGDWGTILARDPDSYLEPSVVGSPDDRRLHFRPGLSELGQVFRALGGRWVRDESGVGPAHAVVPKYPLISRLDDYCGDVVYHPSEVRQLLTECHQAQPAVAEPHSVRGLDKLMRIARWADELKMDIYFSGN